jgi:hemerythrin superfamily protein
MKEFFDAIRKDHKEVNEILEQLKKTSNGSKKKREELFLELKKELVPHMEAEEHVLYPALKKSKEALEDVLESLEEHHVSEMVLKELASTPKDDETWKAKLSVFKDLVDHHVQEEEEKIFKDAEQYLGEDKLKGLFKSFKEEKEKVKSKFS